VRKGKQAASLNCAPQAICWVRFLQVLQAKGVVIAMAQCDIRQETKFATCCWLASATSHKLRTSAGAGSGTQERRTADR